MRGLGQMAVDEAMVRAELDGSWEVLTEAVQTVMRKHGIGDAYEQLKAFSRGAAIDRDGMRSFVDSLDLPEEDKKRLLALTPETYTGIAGNLVRHVLDTD